MRTVLKTDPSRKVVRFYEAPIYENNVAAFLALKLLARIAVINGRIFPISSINRRTAGWAVDYTRLNVSCSEHRGVDRKMHGTHPFEGGITTMSNRGRDCAIIPTMG